MTDKLVTANAAYRDVCDATYANCIDTAELDRATAAWREARLALSPAEHAQHLQAMDGIRKVSRELWR